MHARYVLILLIILFLTSAKYKFIVNVDPEDAFLTVNNTKMVNNQLFTMNTKKIELVCKRWGYKNYSGSFTNNNFVSVKKINITLEPEKYKIMIDVVNEKSEIVINDKSYGWSPVETVLKYGIYKLRLKRADYPDQECLLYVYNNNRIEFKQFKNAIPIKLIGVFKCRCQPKQVLFSPDDRSLFIPLLHDNGFDVFDIERLQFKANINIPIYGNDKGFPEGLFFEKYNTFLISQMTTGKIFEYSVDGLKLLRTIDSHGTWSKFMAKSDKLGVFAVSNWSSNDISIIDYKTGELVTKINTDPAPRGLAFDSKDRYLYATTFEGGTIIKINTTEWKIEKKIIVKEQAAMRHIILTNDDSKAYAANMFHSEIYEIDTGNLEITNTYKVDYNPNTISLTPDNRYLFVSCRGPNDDETYLKRSPRNGYITIIDMKEAKIISQFEGGNQPTGLAVSHNGKYLCFTNFKDDNFELYYIGELP